MILLSMTYQLLSDQPNFQPPSRVPFHKLSDVENFAHDGLTKGIIRASKSPLSSPLIMVQKKDGTTRFCEDFRTLNESTVTVGYSSRIPPPPNGPIALWAKFGKKLK